MLTPRQAAAAMALEAALGSTSQRRLGCLEFIPSGMFAKADGGGAPSHHLKPGRAGLVPGCGRGRPGTPD